MNRLMLRASSSAMAVASAMLMGIALVVGSPQIAAAAAAPVCPAEPQNGKCTGTCSGALVCTPGTETFPDGTTHKICGCIPKATTDL